MRDAECTYFVYETDNPATKVFDGEGRRWRYRYSNGAALVKETRPEPGAPEQEFDADYLPTWRAAASDPRSSCS